MTSLYTTKDGKSKNGNGGAKGCKYKLTKNNIAEKKKLKVLDRNI